MCSCVRTYVRTHARTRTHTYIQREREREREREKESRINGLTTPQHKVYIGFCQTEGIYAFFMREREKERD